MEVIYKIIFLKKNVWRPPYEAIPANPPPPKKKTPGVVEGNMAACESKISSKSTPTICHLKCYTPFMRKCCFCVHVQLLSLSY